MGALDWLLGRSAPARDRGRLGNPRRPSTIVAAGQPGRGANDARDVPNAPREPWQSEAWVHYDRVGEFHYTAGFVGGCLSRCRLSVGVLGADDRAGPLFDDEGMVADGVDETLAIFARQLVASIRPQVGAQGAVLAGLGKNLAVAGDGWLLGQDLLDEADRVVARWFTACSRDELVPGPNGGWARKATPSSQPEPLPEGSYLLRIYRPHPRYSLMADASAKALGPVLERMHLLTLAGKAQTLSRLAGAGVLWIPDEIDFDDDADAGDDDTHPLQRALVEAFGQAVQEPGAAAAYTPYVVTVPGEKIDQIRHDRFTPDDFDVDAKREKAVQQFAQGVDLPPEQVTGVGGSNHWSAWAIDEATYRAHIEPVFDLITGALTAGYLLPQLAAAYGPALPPEAHRLVVVGDSSALVVHPNREQAADVGVGTAKNPSFMVSMSTWRRTHSFSEADAPDAAEVEERLAVAARLNEKVTAEGTAPSTDVADVPGPPAIDGQPAAGGLPATTVAAVQSAVALAAERAADRIAAKARDRARAAGHAEVLNGSPARDTVRVLRARGVEFALDDRDLPPGEFGPLRRHLARLLDVDPADEAARRLLDSGVALASERAFALAAGEP